MNPGKSLAMAYALRRKKMDISVDRAKKPKAVMTSSSIVADLLKRRKVAEPQPEEELDFEDDSDPAMPEFDEYELPPELEPEEEEMDPRKKRIASIINK